MGFTFPGNPFSSPNILVPLVMLSWVPIVVFLFTKFPARKAVIISFLVAWLFLPNAELQLAGLPEFNKITATSYGILLATFIFDVGRFSSFRFGWIDLPMVAWCISPFISSLTNDLGPYDGASSMLTQIVTWGVPYFLGRIYLNSLDGLRQFAMGILVGGLVYVPLCLFEIRFSPQLHRIIYGGHASGDFAQTMRLGGFRPTVFMQHGLAVGAFMMAATLIGIWFWRAGIVQQIWGIPIEWLNATLFVTFVLAKSTGSYALMAIGLAGLFVGKQLRTALPIFLIIASIGVYLYVNAETNTYFTDQLVAYLSQIFPEDRVASLEFRFNNEELLVDRARERLMFGWGGWGRNLLFDETGRQITVPDSLWIITFGERGIFGLVSLFTAMLLPIASLFWLRYPARLWFNRKVAATAVLGMTTTLYMIDCLVNAMINPLYILACGGIAGLVLKRESIRQTVRSRLAPPPKRYLRSAEAAAPEITQHL